MPIRERFSKRLNRTVYGYDFMIAGRRFRKWLPQARTKREARQIEADVLSALNHTGRRADESPNFSAFVDHVYLPYSQANKRSYKADYWYCQALKAFFGRYQLHEIKPLLVEAYKRERLNTPTARGARQNASVNREVEVLSRILSMAEDDGAITGNACRKVKRLRETKRDRYLTSDEERRLMAVLAVPSRQMLRACVVLALNTGMRRGEIIGLTWGDVHLDRGLVMVRDAKSMTGRVNRPVMLNAAARGVFEELRRYADGDGSLVFCGVDWVNKGFRWACGRAGISNLRFHDLRHTFAVRLLEAGADAFTVSSLLGHTSVQMTARYAHATEQTKRRAVDALGLSQNCLKLESAAGDRKAAGG
jgi:integrase